MGEGPELRVVGVEVDRGISVKDGLGRAFSL